MLNYFKTISNNMSIYFIVFCKIKLISCKLYVNIYLTKKHNGKFNWVGNIMPAHQKNADVILVERAAAAYSSE